MLNRKLSRIRGSTPGRNRKMWEGENSQKASPLYLCSFLVDSPEHVKDEILFFLEIFSK